MENSIALILARLDDMESTFKADMAEVSTSLNGRLDGMAETMASLASKADLAKVSTVVSILSSRLDGVISSVEADKAEIRSNFERQC